MAADPELASVVAVRARLRRLALNIVERLEYQTGLAPGAQAERLCDDMVSAFAAESEALGQLYDAEAVLGTQATQAESVALVVGGVRLAPDFRIEGAGMAEVLEMFDVTAPVHHAQLATELLASARQRGAAGDVVSYLALVADADTTEGVFALAWPDQHGLPAPGEIVTLGGEFPEQIRGPVQVVGFGRSEGTLRVRPLVQGPSDELGPPSPGEDHQDPDPGDDEPDASRSDPNDVEEAP